jgi:YopX protein
MREIKFRAWDEIEKLMHYFGLYDIEKPRALGGQIPYERDGTIYYFSTWRQPLMQSTGLHDKNGKHEIYQGDLMRHPPDGTEPRSVFEIFWDQKRCQFRMRDKQNSIGWDIDERFEVIGNIYENPELLQGAVA